MKLAAMFGSSTNAVGAAAGAAVLLVAAAIGLSLLKGEDGSETGGPEAGAPQVAAVGADAAGGETGAEGASSVETDAGNGAEPVAGGGVETASAGAGGAESAPAGGDAPALPAPTLDVVRVEPDGNALIAGQAAPGTTVAILLDGVEVALAEADAAGNFVALLTLDPSDAPRALGLEARDAEGSVVAGAETVLISPFSGTALVADGEAGASIGDIAAMDADGTGDDGAAAEGAPATGATGAAGGADASGAAGTEGGTAAEIATAEVGSAAADGAAGDVVASAQAGGGASAEGAGTGTDTDVAVTGTGTGVAAAGTGADVAASGTGTEGAATSTGTEAAATMAGEGASADGAPLVVASAPSAPDTPPAPGQPGTDVSAPSQPATAGSPTRSEAPAVVIAGPGGVRIAQGPGAMPEAQTEVRLDAISYDAEGAVILAGRGPAETDIRVLINNQPIQLGEIGPGGAWSLQLPDVDPGTYTLSVAGLAPDGTVASQVDTPFLREDPDRIAGSPATASGGTEVITVQPGFTLWGMAHDRFGEGILYVQIFEENRDQIEDPDWIFPGQIFRMPDLPRVPDSD